MNGLGECTERRTWIIDDGPLVVSPTSDITLRLSPDSKWLPQRARKARLLRRVCSLIICITKEIETD